MRREPWHSITQLPNCYSWQQEHIKIYKQQLLFLTMRVKNKKPDKDDWGKLKRVSQYLNGTNNLKLHISVDDLGILKWYVDKSHNVHWNYKGHVWVMFTLGQGAVTSYLRKVKLKTQSLTKTELVGADMYMLEMFWMLYFIQSQGFNMKTI
jgi:hypothetical protein